MNNRETREYIIDELDKLYDIIPGMWGCNPMYYVGSENWREDYIAKKDVGVMELLSEAIRLLTETNELEDE